MNVNMYSSQLPKTKIPCQGFNITEKLCVCNAVYDIFRLEALLDSGLALGCFRFYKKSSPGFAQLLNDVRLFAMSEISMQSDLDLCHI